MKFTLTIELGNNAMQTYGDIARLLGNLAYHDLYGPGCKIMPRVGEDCKLRDDNGNTVGQWEVSE